jgi:probable H4MPT-linked C1 transfer pathway protein
MRTSDADGPWLALDVGGANIKAAHEQGPCRTLPFELWRDPSALSSVLETLLASVPPFGRIALTMTAELCDCYATKAEGVAHVLEATVSAFGRRPLVVWCADGCFRDVPGVLARPSLAAAANWLALAEVVARIIPEHEGLLIDIGSTTTDIVLLARGHARPMGRTDPERLATGELVYAGVRRTPVCALTHELPYRGRSTGVAAELFATTLDVYLTLGSIPPDLSDRATSDGLPATVSAARGRLARMIGADRDGFDGEDARILAEAADSALTARLAEAVSRVASAGSTPPRSAILSGSGEFLARAVLRRLPQVAAIASLAELWGAEASVCACARALLLLASEGSASSVSSPDI